MPEDSPKTRSPRLRGFAAAGILLCTSALLVFLAGNVAVMCCSGSVFDDPDELPERETALVLGCSPTIGQRRNLFFRSRMDAAAALYHAGKVKKLLLSGDNGKKYYNEPEAMRRELIARGVPDEAIYCDYAGFRTLDSVIRAKKVFHLEQCIIVSQRFHCERAVFLAGAAGVDAVGFAAADIDAFRWKLRNRFRETIARPAAVLDLLVARKPRFLGRPVDMNVPQIKAD